MSDYAKLLERHSRELDDLADEHAEAFLAQLKNLQGELRIRLDDLGDPADSLNAFRAKAIIDETKISIARLEQRVAKKFNPAASEAVRMATEHVAAELTMLAKAVGAENDIEGFTLSAQKALSDPAQKMLAEHFGTSVKRYGLDLLNDVRRRLFVGLRTGDSVGSIAKEISGKVGPLGTVGKSNAERLVRTEISNVYGAAQHHGIHQAAKQIPKLEKMWIHVSSYICNTCIHLHKTTRPIDGTWTITQGKRSREVVHAPAHPNCTCRVTAMKDSWKDKLAKLGHLDIGPEPKAPASP